jgi:hypothetical protein
MTTLGDVTGQRGGRSNGPARTHLATFSCQKYIVGQPQAIKAPANSVPVFSRG